jgi:copper(I)-binding protein
MLMDLKRPLKAGETVPVTLIVESGGRRESVEIVAPVRELAAPAPAAAGHKH